MEDERLRILTSLAYVIIANELGLAQPQLTEEELTTLMLKNEVTMDEMWFLDELVQNVIEEVKNNDG